MDFFRTCALLGFIVATPTVAGDKCESHLEADNFDDSSLADASSISLLQHRMSFGFPDPGLSEMDQAVTARYTNEPLNIPGQRLVAQPVLPQLQSTYGLDSVQPMMQQQSIQGPDSVQPMMFQQGMQGTEGVQPMMQQQNEQGAETSSQESVSAMMQKMVFVETTQTKALEALQYRLDQLEEREEQVEGSLGAPQCSTFMKNGCGPVNNQTMCDKCCMSAMKGFFNHGNEYKDSTCRCKKTAVVGLLCQDSAAMRSATMLGFLGTVAGFVFTSFEAI